MTFRADIDSDLETILGAEFATRIVFSPGEVQEWDTTGIFDDSYEEMPVEEGSISARERRFTIFYRNRPRDVVEREVVRVYSDIDSTEFQDYRVRQIPEAGSEGEALIMLEDL